MKVPFCVCLEGPLINIRTPKQDATLFFYTGDNVICYRFALSLVMCIDFICPVHNCKVICGIWQPKRVKYIQISNSKHVKHTQFGHTKSQNVSKQVFRNAEILSILSRPVNKKWFILRMWGALWKKSGIIEGIFFVSSYIWKLHVNYFPTLHFFSPP